MNVRMLKEELEQFNDEDQVVGAWDSGYSKIHFVEYDDEKHLVVLDVENYGDWDE